MTRRHRLHVRKVVTSRAEASAYLRSAGDAVLVERGTPRWLLMRCPCGCGAELPINLDPRAGKAWRLYKTPKGDVSLYPSVWRDTECRSHFVIWRDNILLFGGAEEEFGEPRPREEASSLAAAVLNRLPASAFVSFVDVADALGEIPWDVLHALRGLAKRGFVREGLGRQRGTFCRSRIDEDARGLGGGFP